MPHISVIIPTYNRAALIGESIQSVIDQTYTDWELIVVDDGSTDSTKEQVASYGPQVRYVFQANSGPCAARNHGLALAQGELLLFLDSDDLLLPHALQSLVETLDAHPGCAVAYGWYYWMGEDGCPRAIEMPPIVGSLPPQRDSPWGALTPRPSGPTAAGDALPALIQEETMLLGAALMRRALVESAGGFDPTIVLQEHWDFYLRLAAAGARFACAQQAVAAIRLHGANRSADYAGMLAARLAVVDRICADQAHRDQLAPVGGRARANAYLEYAPLYYKRGDAERGRACLLGALAAVELTHADRLRVSFGMITGALDTSHSAPERVAEAYLAALPDGPQARQLRDIVLPAVYREQALRLYRAGSAGRAGRYAARALLSAPRMRRSRILMRIALEGMLGSRLFDLTRSVADTRLLKRAAATVSIFVSPHFDDAVLSCGGMLAHLAQRGAPIVLLTVFTALPEPGAPVSPLAQRTHDRQGDEQIYRTRRSEERRVAAALGARTRWLELPDAIYRDLGLRFTAELFLEDYDPRQDPAYAQVRESLRAATMAHPGALIFAPLGIGNHRDHLLVNAAIRDLLAAGLHVAGCYFYEDYPYVAGTSLRSRLDTLGRSARASTVDIRQTLQRRVELIRMYSSQLAMIFHDPEQIEQDVLSYAAGIGTRYRPRERYWSGA